MKWLRDNAWWNTFFVFSLVVMATWTIVIKFVTPLLYSTSSSTFEGSAELPIMWDFWWVAHLYLAWALWNYRRDAWVAAALISLIEVIIVITKFFFFALEPEDSVWRLLWFTNKVYVLVIFMLLTAFCVHRPYLNYLSSKGIYIPKGLFKKQFERSSS